MASTIEQAVIAYLEQKEKGEPIRLDVEGKYEEFPVEEVKAAILDLCTEIGDIYNMHRYEIKNQIPSPYPASNEMARNILRLSTLAGQSSQGIIELVINKDFHISSEALLAKIPEIFPYVLGSSRRVSKASQVLREFKRKIEELKDRQHDPDIETIFDAAEQFLLDRLDQLPEGSPEYKQIVQQIASSLGNCPTPVKQLLFLVAVQLPPELRENLSASKMQEVQQRVAFRYALTRQLRQESTFKYEDQADYVEELCDTLFSQGEYNFNFPFLHFNTVKLSNERIPHILLKLGLVNGEDQNRVNTQKLHNFIKSDLLSLAPITNNETRLFNNALDRVQKAILKEIEANSEVFSTEYLKPVNERFNLINPDKVAEHFESSFRVWSERSVSSSLNERNVKQFTENYIGEQLKTIENFVKLQSQETTFERGMITTGNALNPNVSTSGGGSAQTSHELYQIQGKGVGRAVRR